MFLRHLNDQTSLKRFSKLQHTRVVLITALKNYVKEKMLHYLRNKYLEHFKLSLGSTENN